jgi:putative endonuclease
LARKYLEEEGIRIVVMNFRGRRGEIDLVAREGEFLIFCEVKFRAREEYGPPEEAVTALKQRTIRAVAEEYLVRYRLRDQACRFDVVAIRESADRVSVNHIRNAF